MKPCGSVPGERVTESLFTRGGITWAGVFLLVLAWSAIQPFDRFIWWLEVSPALIAAGVLLLTRRRFPLTPLTYWLILFHCIILMVGGHYTYAEVPLFDWLAEVFNWQRNNFDKVGHFAQGFVPAIVAREILLRNSVVNGRIWLGFIIVCISLAISALYELVEWWVALLTGTAADAFLATQGDIWDTQSDMAWALFGAIVALALLGRWHDRQLQSLAQRHN
jgi:putative membrane protein